MSISVRTARTEVVDLTDSDLAEIHDLRCRAADFFAEVGDDPPTPESLRGDLADLPEGFTSADETVYRAYSRGGGTGEYIVAYAEVLRGWPEQDGWIIGILLVDSALRSQGIGPQLLADIERDAREAGARQLLVGVITSRAGSLSFWKREGFTTEMLRRRLEIGETQHEVVRLAKDL